MKQIRSIQMLRAIAAFIVLMGHLRSIELKHDGATSLSAIWTQGAAGVDLFFVISGFIMVWVAGDYVPAWQTMTRFLYSRITRIYPLWWLYAGSFALYLWISHGQPWDAKTLSTIGVSGPEHLLKSALLLPQNGLPVLNVGWTLVHEMYFYIGFALLILFPLRYRLAYLCVWGLGVGIAATMGFSAAFAGTVVELVTYPMTLQFILGALIAYAIKGGVRVAPYSVLGAGLVCMLAGLLLVSFGDAFRDLAWREAAGINLLDGDYSGLAWKRTLLIGPPAAMIIYGLTVLELQKRLSIPSVLVSLGDWSYGLYLCHILVISATARLYFPLFGSAGHWDNVVFNVIAILAAIAVSAVSYACFEKPVAAGLRKQSRQQNLAKAV